MNKVITFVLGAAAGSLLTWKLVEKKYRDLAAEEIEAVKEYYKGKYEKTEEIKVVEAVIETNENENEEVNEYSEYVNDLGYSVEEDGSVWVEPGEEKTEPYVISPDEYGDKPGYDTKEWTYYADSVLTDEEEEIVWDPEAYLGDGLKHFGDFEDDAVHVRNEYTECDYEILKDARTFSEVYKEDV